MASNDAKPTVIARRVKKIQGGGHHGGSWKVAYADFVTAMMAFFLVMWLMNITTTEQRIIRRLLNLTLESYGKSWDPVYPIEFDYVRSEMHTKFASITGNNEVVVVTSFHIEFGATGGDLNICLPYSMIEPVRDLLTRPLQETTLEEVDQRWSQQLSRQVRSADIDVVAEFARIPSSIRELMRMKVGDILPVDVPQTVIAHVDGVFNAVVAEGDFVGRSIYEGRGAGAGPTASAVAADLVDLARGCRTPTFGVPVGALKALPAAPLAARQGAYYMRLMVVDRPGVLADVAAALRDEQVSVEQMIQPGRAPGETVPMVMTLHDTDEAAMERAVARIGKLRAVVEPPRIIRIEHM